MVVIKFGGTSLGNAERIRQVAGLIENYSDCFVVCSAMSGVTNTLVETAAGWSKGDITFAAELTEDLRKRFLQTCYELFDDAGSLALATGSVNSSFDIISSRIKGSFSEKEENWLLAQGELVTSEIIAGYLNQRGIAVTWLNVLDFMRTGSDNEPSVFDIRSRLENVTGKNPKGRFLTQGYICLDHKGETSNLKRGGSDYTATLLGAALLAESIEIWTDIDGVRNNDPRIVENTFPIRALSFDEAAELAYFGAKILHPACVWPASTNNIIIKLKNTMDPDAPGTIIGSGHVRKGITAVAAKEGITVIRIRSDRMLNAYGFLNRIFGIFETYKTPIDVITTSEVAVSVTIDDSRHLNDIVSELGKVGSVTVETGQAIVCVVGDILEQHQDRAVKILESLVHFNVKMISFGGSRNNITIVIPREERNDVLRTLNSSLFSNQSQTNDPWLISQT